MKRIFICIVISLIYYISCSTTGLDQTNGKPWPLPFTYNSFPGQFHLNSENFKFKISAKNCPILQVITYSACYCDIVYMNIILLY